jgi:hypothetical protein
MTRKLTYGLIAGASVLAATGVLAQARVRAPPRQGDDHRPGDLLRALDRRLHPGEEGEL